MLKIYPFRALVPKSKFAAEVSCPPYDVLSVDEAREIAVGNEHSFVRVIRPEVDPTIENAHSPKAYQAARESLLQVVDSETMDEHEPSIYLYRQSVDQHEQTGVVCCYDVEQYRQGLIKKHETTRPDKETDRVEHMLACGAHPEPVLLTFPSNADLNSLMESDCQSIPIFDFQAPDGVQHTAWRVQDADAYVGAFGQVDAGYIADGHHRTAAADRAAMQRQQANPNPTGDEEYNRVLSVFFPVDQLRILAYNRVVTAPSEMTASDILQALQAVGTVTDAGQSIPDQAGQICFYVGQTWRTLTLDKAQAAEAGLIESLDVSLLQSKVLTPVFGIDDPRTHPAIGFVGGSRGIQILEEMVDRGEVSVAFSMYPTGVQDLLDVSDSGSVMPPKSTWFDPKLRSGLFVHRFDL